MNYLRIPVEIPNARLWECKEPWLYQAQVRILSEENEVLDEQKRQFGMRFFEMDTESSPKGVFRLNNRKIKLRGVNSQGREQRMVFLKDFDRLFRDYLLAKVGNINFLRITQRPVQPEVYDCCDKLGLLVQTDFPAFGSIRRNKVPECLKQVQEMEHLIRSHPCCIIDTYINEPFPNGQNRPHRSLERDEMEMFFDCADKMIHMLNPDRVIKAADGDYDPPTPEGLPDYHCYTCWYNGHGLDFGLLHKGYWLPVKEGWNCACGEYGMEGMDPVDLMKKYYPKEWLPKNDDDLWTPDTIPGDPPPQLGHLHHFFYETPKTMAEWVDASQIYQAQVMNYMTRAYRRNRRMISYAYHLYIDAYPDGWLKAMVDYEGTPKKAFWEFREASAPVMVDLRYDRLKVFSGECINVEARVCNDIDEEIAGAELRYQVYLKDEILLKGKTEVNAAACDNTFVGYIPVQLPEVAERSGLKVQAALFSKDGEMLSGYELDFDVFSNERKNIGKVCLIGAAETFASKLEKEFDVCLVGENDADADTTVMVFDFAAYSENEEKLLNLAKNGAKLIVFSLPKGNVNVAGSDVYVKECGMGAVHFVERVKEHEIVSDFKSDDCRYWYDEDKGMISPILNETFTAEGFEAILTSANKAAVNYDNTDVGRWVKEFALAERKFGDGVVRICQINLQNRVVMNPVAKILIERLCNM